MNPKKPTITILTTGGTISSISSHSSMDYTIGEVQIDSILAKLPPIMAHIHIKQIANIDSADIDSTLLLTLAKETNTILESSDAVVITHGTDTLEESALFLHLTIKSQKPVILLGAMRPSNALCFDGIDNLYNALCLCLNPQAINQGVLVVMNNTIFSARDVHKSNTFHINAFCGGEIGSIIDGEAFFRYKSLMPHTTQTPFDISMLTNLPKVAILESCEYPNICEILESFRKNGIQGIIIAGSGAGSIHKSVRSALSESDFIIIRSSKIPQGFVLPKLEDRQTGFIPSYDFNAQKSRILLMLILTQTQDRDTIARFYAHI